MSKDQKIFLPEGRYIFTSKDGAITTSLLDMKIDQGFKDLVIPEELMPLNSVEYLQQNIDSKKYFIQLGYWGQPSNDNINLGMIDPALEWRKSESKEEAIKVFDSTVVPFFNETWKDYLPQSFIDSYDVCYPLFKEDSCLIIKYKNNLVGTALLLDGLKDYNEKLVSQLGWIYIAKEVPIPLRKEMQLIIEKWLSENAKLKIQAGIHLYNTRSQKFVTRMGFELKCAHILKR